MSWQTLRTVTTLAAEGTTAPDASVFLGIEADERFVVDSRVQYLEIGIDSLSVAGSPASVTFGIWRSSDTSIDRLGSFTVAAASVGIPTPQIIDFHGEKCWVTVESFSGGTAPTATATIRVRPVRL
jgi:hypothetical protein